MWRTARLDAICRRTKLSRSSACAARSTKSTKLRAAQGAGRANLAAPFRGAFTTSTGDRVQRGEEMLRTWVIAGFAVAASTGPTLGRTPLPASKCSSDCAPPATKLGRTPKSSSAHRSMASMAARAAPSRVSTTLQPTNLLASPGARKLSPNISARRCKKCRARAWHLSASRTIRASQTSGPISSSSELMGRRNEANWQEGKKQESRWACRRSGSSHVSAGLTGLLNTTCSQRRLSRPSNHRRRSRWTASRASHVKWKDDTHPPANIFPTIIFLVYIAREIALQDHRAETVAEEAAHRELALLLIT